MADTFFGFGADLNNGDNLLPDDDDCVENEEEEYDALNDETFGTLEDSTVLEDWEQEHEQFAENDSFKKQSEQLENSISNLVLDELNSPLNLSKSSVWAYTPPTKNGDLFNSSILSSLQRASRSFIETHGDSQRGPNKPFTQSTPISAAPRQFCTVEELEKSLFKSSTPPKPPQLFTAPLFGRLPPGFPPMGLPPPVRHMPPHPPMPHLPPGLVHPHMLPPFMPPRHPGLIYPPHHLPHAYNFPPPHRGMMPPPPMHPGMMRGPMPPHGFPGVPLHQMNNMNNMNNNNMMRQRHDSQCENRDEYEGLMTTREKQWLLNIQLLQLNTGTPYFDDYYYTVFKERKTKNNMSRDNSFQNERNHGFRNGGRRNNERQDNNNTLTPRVYTPLQFENSLGKLQCGSVTAPRKIIDMDIVTPQDADSSIVVRDTRKTKQLLLELESLFSLLLRAEDLRNPLAISNVEKLREIKQKQRLRELDLAPTAEQKQEVLRLLKQDSEPIIENPHDFIVRIVGAFLHEDKFANFLNIRKGKMLLLRLLPHLALDLFGAQLLEIWTRVLLSIPVIGRRDTAGDHILPRLHPFFKRYIQTSTMADVIDIGAGLVEAIKQENSRSTPLSHQGKAPLYFVLLNKFGVSALVTLFIRSEYLISSEAASEKQQSDWADFLGSWAELTGAVTKVATPIESIPVQIFGKHCNRFVNVLTTERKLQLEKYFVSSD